jgi:hypothetical protein
MAGLPHSTNDVLMKGHKENPKHVPIIFALYRLYRGPHPAKAFKMAKKLHEIVPDRIEYALLLASMYSRFGNVQQVIDLLKPIVKENPTNITVIQALCTTYLKVKDFDAADSLLTDAANSAALKRLKTVSCFLQNRDREALTLATEIVQEGSVDLQSAGIFVVLKSQGEQDRVDWCFDLFHSLDLDEQTLNSIQMTTQNIRESRERILDDIVDASLKRRVRISPIYQDPTRRPVDRAAANGLFHPQRTL